MHPGGYEGGNAEPCISNAEGCIYTLPDTARGADAGQRLSWPTSHRSAPRATFPTHREQENAVPTPIVPGCLQLSFVHEYAGQIGENVLHANGEGIATAIGLNDRLTAAATAWQDNVLPFLSDDTKFLRVDGVMLNGPGSLEDSFTVPGAPIGDGGGSLHSQVEALCLTKWSGLTGRTNRGRIYIGGIPSGAIAEGMVDTTYANNVRGGLNAFSAQMAATAAALVILSRKDLAMKPLNEFKIHDYAVDTQRRRLPEHNRHH